MSRTIRHRHDHGKDEESRTRSHHHRYDGHKQAALVNHQHLERNAGQVGTRRLGRQQ